MWSTTLDTGLFRRFAFFLPGCFSFTKSNIHCAIGEFVPNVIWLAKVWRYNVNVYLYIFHVSAAGYCTY